MLKASLFFMLVGLVVGGPSFTKTRQQIESFRNFLEKTRTDHGVRLSERVFANPKASAWENSGKFEGDILLDDWQVDALVKSYAGSRNAFVWFDANWPDNTIVYDFADSEFNGQQREAIMIAIEDIEENTCVKFRERRPDDFNYVKLTNTDDGCYANVGYWEARGEHILNLALDPPGQGCFRHATIVHEWLHIIGFFHMHSTYNRDEYVRILWDNIIPDQEHNFALFDEEMVDNMGLPYEYNSCMHYGAYGFSVNGKPTIEALQSFEGVMGQQEYVTENDWLRVRRHYKCPVKNSKTKEENGQKVNFVDKA
ncbi:PREDICTED: astacin-like metalloprotease toxin 5 [Papilio xuthus]|uniref:Metalloendopeptidase n=1 Tax=Papilio xuthus TaxID=66420 RepID=A0AAJ6Z7A1_PAPXU|nr:PREDICTED: astacin-like metalloprotease toxin 5 [Papilio xuthus]